MGGATKLIKGVADAMTQRRVEDVAQHYKNTEYLHPDEAFKAAEPVRETETVWHGGAKKYDEPSLDFVRTGTGGTAQGHGFYVAQQKDVGEDYRRIVSRDAGLDEDHLKEYFKPGNIVPSYAGRDKVVRFNPTVPGQRSWSVDVQKVDSAGNPIRGERVRNHATQPDAMAFNQVTGRNPGYLYELKIPKGISDQMLDLDLPLSAQSEGVKKAILGDEITLIDNTHPEWPGGLHKGLLPENMTGKEFYRLQVSGEGGDQAASEYLHSLGIPGNKYFDANSRATMEGTRNLVLFDPEIAEIVKRNEEKLRAAGLLTAGSLAGFAVVDEAEAGAGSKALKEIAIKIYGPDVAKQVGDLTTKRIMHTVPFYGTLSPDGQKYIRAVKNRQNTTAVHHNSKTGLSVDFSTTCPKKACKGGACAYCYVEQPRTEKKLGIWSAGLKPEAIENPYAGELLHMPKEVVDGLNQMGGLRLFSFGDYRPDQDYENVAGLLADAQKKGLYIKAITKEKALIDEFGDHPNLRANISVDYMPRELSNAATVDEALEWKGDRDNVKVRSVALTEAQAELQAQDPRIDVVTLYHGSTGDKLLKTVRLQNPELVARNEDLLMQELGTWENMGPRSKIAKRLQEKYPGRFCCFGGKCSKDNNKCGFGLGAVIPGVMIPAWLPVFSSDLEAAETAPLAPPPAPEDVNLDDLVLHKTGKTQIMQEGLDLARQVKEERERVLEVGVDAPPEGTTLPKQEAPEDAINWKEVALDVGRGVTELPEQIPGAAIDSINATLQFANDFGSWLDENVADLRLGTLVGMEGMEPAGTVTDIELPTTEEAESETGKMVRDMGRFIFGYWGAGKASVFKPMLKKIGGKTKIGEAAMKGIFGDFIVSEEGEENLFNLAKEYGFENELTEFMSVDPAEGDDAALSKILGDKLKTAAEGGVFGLTIDATQKMVQGVVKAARMMRAARRTRESMPDEAKAEFDLLEQQTKTQRSAFETALGNPEDPVVSLKKPIDIETGDIVSPTAKEVPEHTPDQVYINWSRIDGENDIESVLQALADADKAGVDKTRRGVVSHAETQLSADQENAWALLQKNSPQVLNESQTLALRRLWVASGEKVKELAIAAHTDPSDANNIALEKMLAVHNTVQQRVLGVRTEQARALGQWRIPAGGTANFSAQMNALTDLANMHPGSTRVMAEGIAKMAKMGDTSAIDHMVRGGAAWKKYGKLTKDGVLQLWYFSLLSSGRTHIRNFIGNAAVMAFNVAERKLARGIGLLRGEENIAPGEAGAMAFGFIQGLKDSFRIRKMDDPVTGKIQRGGVWESLKTGTSGFGVGKVDAASMTAFDPDIWGVEGANMRRVMKFLDVTSTATQRALIASDELFSTMNYNAEMQALAFRRAFREVEEGTIDSEMFKGRVEELINDPDEQAKVLARKQAKYSVFTERPEETNAWKGWKGLAQFPVLGRLSLPFRRTPYNIAKFTFEHTPLAPLVKRWRDDIAAGGAKADLAWAKLLTGNTMLLLAADTALDGQTTGQMPVNRAERQTLERNGIRPMTTRGDEGGYSYGYRGMEPTSSPFGIAASIVEIINAETDDEVVTEDLVIAATFAVMAQLTSANYMSGFSDMMEMQADPTRHGPAYARGLARTIAPNIVADVETAMSPEMSYVTDLTSAVKARVPGLSKDVPTSHDLWGRKRTRESGKGLAYDVISPMGARPVKPEPIDKFLRENRIWIGTPSHRMSFPTGKEFRAEVNMKNHPKEFQRFLQLAGQEITKDRWGAPITAGSFMSTGGNLLEELNKVVQGKHPILQGELWNMLTSGKDGGKDRQIREIIHAYQETAKYRLLEEFPALKHKVDTRSKIGKYDLQ